MLFMIYDHKTIESKWQARWDKENVFAAKDSVKPGKKKYVLDMFPYPSGAGLHVGHPEGYTATDIYCRYLRMKGYEVLHPMGWDAFGLPAENYAIKSGVHPKESTEQNIRTFTRQIKSLGFSYDWSRELSTSDPDYYRWTQWLFLQLYKAGLAYKKAAPVNWCPSCQTVLANEQVVDGKCERCGSAVEMKNLEQWFFKITGASKKEKGTSNKGVDKNSYPERLLNNLDKLDWPEPIKTMQRNWIGRSEGAEIAFPIVIAREGTPDRSNPANRRKWHGIASPLSTRARNDIRVFTTRPDTLFGATYMVLAPEHQLVQELKGNIKNWKEVSAYIKKAAGKSALERTDLAKEKTGVELKGVKAINPANNEEIPIWIADYVLAGYGTGAIMAVPAHDERDFEFAKKYDLPIRQVIAPYFTANEGKDAVQKGKPIVKRKTINVFLKHSKEDKYVCLDWEKFGWHSGIIGGIEEGEDLMSAAVREIEEETGYKDIAFVRYLGGETHNHFYAAHKNENRYAVGYGLLFKLNSEKKNEVDPEHTKNHTTVWIEGKKMAEWLNLFNFEYMWQVLSTGHECFSGDGILINSAEFDGQDSTKAKWSITAKVGGKRTTQYKLRDWLISRQRYWGAPIPIIYCDDCARLRQGFGGQGEHPVPEEDLPVVLPDDVDFRPTGESPLARSKKFQDVKCPKCGLAAQRESDTMDTFVDSSWYFLRYIDPKNKKEFADKKKLKTWMPVDTYVGGAEHAVLHLMYARFFCMALRDLGHLDFEEPFLKLRNQGLIMGPDGQKMSKSRGNVINPDDVIDRLGADTMRMYEMFMGPLEDAKPWDTDGIIGVRRFLERVWSSHKLQVAGYKKKESKDLIERELHKLIKKVSEDIESFGFNTSVAQFMIFVNLVQKTGEVSKEHFAIFLKVLNPFAPHITNELWEKLGNKNLIEKEKWPKYSEKLLVEDRVVYVVQVNNKVRGNITVNVGVGEDSVASLAKKDQKVAKYLAGGKIVKQIFVSGKLINFVVKK